MATTKKQWVLKDSVKQTGRRAKDYATQKARKVQAYGRQYGSDVNSAFNQGYRRGWEDAYSFPKRFGSRAAASFGYGRGIRDRQRTDKYNKRYKGSGRK